MVQADVTVDFSIDLTNTDKYIKCLDLEGLLRSE
jgi:hypothetical protein